MNFIALEISIIRDPKIKLLMDKYKNALIVWIYLLIKFAQEEESGFMIFINEKWYTDFAKEIGLPKSQIKQIKEIIKEMANIELINPNLFLEDIIFSENFFKKHFRYFLRNRKDFNAIKEKIIKNIEFLFNYRQPNEMHIIKLEDLKKYILDLLESKNNSNENQNNKNNIQGELLPSTETKIQFDHNSLEYRLSIYLTNLLIQKDPNNNDLNRQEGARMFHNLLQKYPKEEIFRAIKYFEDELNSSIHNNIIDRIYSYYTFKQNIKGLISFSKNVILPDCYISYEEIQESLL